MVVLPTERTEGRRWEMSDKESLAHCAERITQLEADLAAANARLEIALSENELLRKQNIEGGKVLSLIRAENDELRGCLRVLEPYSGGAICANPECQLCSNRKKAASLLERKPR